MSVPSTKNLQRKIWRDQCRDILSKHIQERTNIVVEPSQVRLLTTESDPYRWELLPGVPGIKKLFEANLSECSIGPLKKLCGEVGKSFEAVRATNPGKGELTIAQPHCAWAADELPQSFSARVAILTEENEEMKRRLLEANQKLEREIEMKKELEGNIGSLKEQNRMLGGLIEQQSTEVTYLRDYVREFADGIEKFVPVVGEFRTPETRSGSMSIDSEREYA